MTKEKIKVERYLKIDKYESIDKEFNIDISILMFALKEGFYTWWESEEKCEEHCGADLRWDGKEWCLIDEMGNDYPLSKYKVTWSLTEEYWYEEE